ncbi:cyclic nucleotide-binding domain-containing protein [Bacteriovoracaceae bacterium]|nr:cyclic nucleotide-binding domain-containing protein [Bacteriovoracaceae bacterium]
MKKKSILLIDDNEDLLDTVKDMLEDLEFRVVTAKDGRDGAFKFSNEDFDVIISDINLPKLNGVDFVKEIRAIELRKKKDPTPVLLISGNIDEFKSDISLLNNVSCLEKPFTGDDIQEKIDVFFDKDGSKKSLNGERRNIKEKTVLIKEGEKGSEMFWVLSGCFAIVKQTEEGKNVIISRAHVGELLGEMSFLDNQPRSASAIAMEDSEVLVIKNKRFLEIIEKQPGWFRSLLKTLSGRLRLANEKLGKIEI